MQEAVEDLRICLNPSLALKPSAFVILKPKMQGVQPGSRGTLIEIVCLTFLTGLEAEEVVVAMCEFGGKVVGVTRARFSACNSAGDKVAHYEQIALILGMAMTVHRSQGLTLEAVETDLELDNWVTCGLVYTALSSGVLVFLVACERSPPWSRRGAVVPRRTTTRNCWSAALTQVPMVGRS